jgi:hypothetical protein
MSNGRRGAGRRASHAYHLYVALAEIAPPIWRRLIVPGEIPLRRLHRVLQIAMGWTGSEPWAFEVGDLRYGEPEVERPGDLRDARGVRLDQLLPDIGAELLYEYDFSDAWLHTVRLERITPADPAVPIPVCRDGARACPPLGAGGPHVYDELVAAVRDPEHPEHDDVATRFGATFDPDGFDVRRVNERLLALEAS